MVEAARLSAKVSVDGVSGAMAQLKSFDASLKGATGGLVSMGTVGSTALLGVGAAAVGMAVKLGGDAVEAGAKFGEQMSAIQAVSGATDEEIAGLSATAMKIGPALGKSALEGAQGMEELVKAGISTKDIMGGAAQATMTLAVAGGTSLANAAEVAATAIKVFNLQGTDMGHVADIMAGAANASIISVDDLRMSLSMVSSVASMAGQTLDGTTVAIGLMGEAGIKSSDAGTSLKTFLLSLTPASKEAADKMRELGIITQEGANRFYDSTGRMKDWREIAEVLQQSMAGLSDQQRDVAMKVMFGSDAIRAGNTLLKAGAEGYDRFYEAMSKTTALDVAKTRTDNLAGSQKKLTAEWEVFVTGVGNRMEPMIKGVTDALVGVLHNTNAYNQASAEQRAEIDALVASGYSNAEAIELVTGATTNATTETGNLTSAQGALAASFWSSDAGARNLVSSLNEVATAQARAMAMANDPAVQNSQQSTWEQDRLRRAVEVGKEKTEAWKDSMAAAKREATAMGNAAASAAHRAANALADANREADMLSRDMNRVSEELAITLSDLEAEFGQSWIDEWHRVDKAIKETQSSARDALADLESRETLSQTIAGQRRSLSEKLDGISRAHDAERSEAEVSHDLEVSIIRAREDADRAMAKETDSEKRQAIADRLAEEILTMEIAAKRRLEDLAYQREQDEAERLWREENITRPEAELEKKLHEEELQRQRDAIVLRQEEEITRINTEWEEWQEVEREKVDKAKENAVQKAQDELAAMKENFWDKLPEAASAGIDALAARIEAAMGAALAAVAASAASAFGGDGGGAGMSGASYTDPDHAPGGATYEAWKASNPEEYEAYAKEHGIDGYAYGTSYYPGGVGLVGERGPELVRLPRGSQIFPTGTGPGWTGPQVINIQVDGITLASIVNGKQTRVGGATW